MSTDNNGQLRAFVDRIERMNAEADALKADTAEIYNEAKANGYNTSIIRQIVRLRKQDEAKRSEQETLMEIYMRELGMTPLEQYGARDE